MISLISSHLSTILLCSVQPHFSSQRNEIINDESAVSEFWLVSFKERQVMYQTGANVAMF